MIPRLSTPRLSPAAVLQLLAAWRDRAASRRLLGDMDQRGLADIGLDHATAAHEAAKPFWKG